MFIKKFKNMTSIEWLNKELEYFGDPDRCIISWKELDSLIEQAKEMEKQQIVDTWDMGRFNIDALGNGEEYYNETYESKENQKQLIVEIMEEDSKDGLYDIPLQECVNCNEQKQVHSMCLDCCIKLGNQNQTEISDDEIEKEARKLANIKHNRPLDSEERYYKDYQKYDGIVIGMKWYREQLKQKQ